MKTKYEVKYKITIREEMDVTGNVFSTALSERRTEYISLQNATVTAALKCDDELKLKLFDTITIVIVSNN